MLKRKMGKSIKYPYAYDRQRRRIATAYVHGRLVLFAVEGIIVPLVSLIVFLLLGWHIILGNALAGALAAPAFAAVLFTYMTAIHLPFAFYSSYVYEHKFHLSRMTFRRWLSDAAKSLILGYIFTALAISALFYFLQSGPWWLYATIAYVAYEISFNYIFPVVIFPLFYKTKPYTDRAQIARLKEMAGKYGIRIKKVLVANESSRSTKANAFFAGIGNTKRIVLFDTLVNNFPPDEVETVVAHELGHYVSQDVMRSLVIDAVKTLFIFFIIDVALRGLLQSIGVSSMSELAVVPAIILLYIILELGAMPLVNAYSRRREAAADLFALDAAQKPKAQISAERRLVDMSLDIEEHHPLVEFFLRSHPSARKRIAMARKWKKKKPYAKYN